MNKKILLLVGKVGDRTKKFAETINNNISDESVSVEVASFSDLSFVIETNKLEVKVNNSNIKDFSLVYIRRAGITNTILANTLGIYLKHLGIAFFDSVFGEYSAKGNKLRALVQLAINNVSVPKTIYFSNPTTFPDYKYLVEELGLPFIAKDIGTQRGKGIYLISSETDYTDMHKSKKTIQKSKFLYQKFIEKSHEYRVVVMGYKPSVWYEKFPSDTNEFRYNSALGAEEVYYDLGNISDDLKNIATNASKCLKLEISGVDTVVEKDTNKVYVLEANRAPGFTSDEATSPEMKVFSEFLQKSVRD